MSSTSKPSNFQTTCWTQVNEAAKKGQPDNQSLQLLCQRYWYPLYAYLRRTGYSIDVSEDYVQGFFADLLARDSLKQADPSRGKFRTFLLTACKHYVANQHRYSRAQRRGGGQTILSLDVQRGEQRYSAEPVDFADPQKLFDRRWALETIEAALAELEERYRASGKHDRFLVLRQLIAPASLTPSHADLAEQLGMTEGAVKVAAHRLRQQFASALRDQVAATVDLNERSNDGQELVDVELRELLASLG